mmetsp:Transcript_28260/g.51408  ORF Transcript_28260/g.51408 Transcript_28260/m.51408 type:complete len:193 (+) Transcript_28260:51-629(+)
MAWSKLAVVALLLGAWQAHATRPVESIHEAEKSLLSVQDLDGQNAEQVSDLSVDAEGKVDEYSAEDDAQELSVSTNAQEQSNTNLTGDCCCYYPSTTRHQSNPGTLTAANCPEAPRRGCILPGRAMNWQCEDYPTWYDIYCEVYKLMPCGSLGAIDIPKRYKKCYQYADIHKKVDRMCPTGKYTYRIPRLGI